MPPYANLIRKHPLGYIMKVTPYFFASMSLDTDIKPGTALELLMLFMSQCQFSLIKLVKFYFLIWVLLLC